MSKSQTRRCGACAESVTQQKSATHSPEIELATIDPAANLREALDIDSMSELHPDIHHRLGVDIPELDYPKLITLDGALDT